MRKHWRVVKKNKNVYHVSFMINKFNNMVVNTRFESKLKNLNDITSLIKDLQESIVFEFLKNKNIKIKPEEISLVSINKIT